MEDEQDTQDKVVEQSEIINSNSKTEEGQQDSAEREAIERSGALMGEKAENMMMNSAQRPVSGGHKS